MSKLLSVQDVAEQLGKTPRWVRDQRRGRDGFPPGINVGTDSRPEWRFRRSQIDGWLRSRQAA